MNVHFTNQVFAVPFHFGTPDMTQFADMMEPQEDDFDPRGNLRYAIVRHYVQHMLNDASLMNVDAEKVDWSLIPDPAPSMAQHFTGWNAARHLLRTVSPDELRSLLRGTEPQQFAATPSGPQYDPDEDEALQKFLRARARMWEGPDEDEALRKFLRARMWEGPRWLRPQLPVARRSGRYVKPGPYDPNTDEKLAQFLWRFRQRRRESYPPPPVARTGIQNFPRPYIDEFH